MKDAMSPKERVMAIFKGQETDKAAVINPTSVLTMDSMAALGLSCPGVHIDADKMAAAAATGHDLCGFDSVMPKFSVVHSAAALGAEVDWNSGDAMPVIRKHPISDPEQFKMPENFLDHPATKVVLDALRLLKKRYGDSIVIIGKVFGPWTTAYNMCGTQEFLIETALDPEKAARYLEVFTPPPILFAEAQFEAGADMILWGDHVSGDLCSPDAYKDLLLPVHQKIHGSLLKKSGPTILHACGRTIDRAHYFAQSGFEAFHYDSLNNTKEFLAKVDGKMLLTGAVNNKDVLFAGTPENVREQVRQLLDDGIRLISPECAIPLRTPNVNLCMIRTAVDEYYN
ncbi:MAG: MtaA/CmuA family methyltransferase [Spirochaetes bacterium]|nr:MtaA/CmuA family methyltransferase [Spirochaetota bacterium]